MNIISENNKIIGQWSLPTLKDRLKYDHRP